MFFWLFRGVGGIETIELGDKVVVGSGIKRVSTPYVYRTDSQIYMGSETSHHIKHKLSKKDNDHSQVIE